MYIVLLLILIIFFGVFVISYFMSPRNKKEILITKEKEKIEDVVFEKENNINFNKRISKLREDTKLNFKNTLKKSVESKRIKYFEVVDKQIYEIIDNLQVEIENDANGKNTFGYPLEIFEFELKDENDELLFLPISEFFRDNLKKRESYLNLLNKCENFKMNIEIKPFNIRFLDPQNVHPLESSFENYKIIIKSNK